MDHFPDSAGAAAKGFISDLRKKAKERPRDRPRQILSDALADASPEVMAALPTKESMARSVRNARKAEGSRPADPANFDDIDIPPAMLRTISGNALT